MADDPETAELRASIDDALASTEARAAALRRELHEIMESGDLTNTDDEHDPDGATIAYERARTAALLTSAEEELAQLRRARGLVDAGSYGRCRTCGRAIAPERLLALPSTGECIDCAR